MFVDEEEKEEEKFQREIVKRIVPNTLHKEKFSYGIQSRRALFSSSFFFSLFFVFYFVHILSMHENKTEQQNERQKNFCINFDMKYLEPRT